MEAVPTHALTLADAMGWPASATTPEMAYGPVGKVMLLEVTPGRPPEVVLGAVGGEGLLWLQPATSNTDSIAPVASREVAEFATRDM